MTDNITKTDIPPKKTVGKILTGWNVDKFYAIRFSLLCLFTVMWVIVFTFGMLVPSKPFRDQIRIPLEIIMKNNDAYDTSGTHPSPSFDDSFDAFESLRKHWVNIPVILLTWTWSNVFMLSVLSACIGEFGRINARKEPLLLRLQTATARGIFIYLFILAGQLIYVGDLDSPSAKNPSNVKLYEYFRISALISLSSFIAGFSPGFFISIIDNMQKQLLKEPTSDSNLQ